jgi:hypothetical protein
MIIEIIQNELWIIDYITIDTNCGSVSVFTYFEVVEILLLELQGNLLK